MTGKAEKRKEEWIHCNECGHRTEQFLVHTYRNQEFLDVAYTIDGSINAFCDWQLLECQGCKTVCLRLKSYFSVWDDEGPSKEEYYPARNCDARVKPHWLKDFLTIENLKGHFINVSYVQIYQLIEAGQYLAAVLTARALLETIAIENGAGDKRTFKEKLEALRDKELIRTKQIEFLEKTIYDAGSAAMHRSYNPSPTAVTHVLDAIEHLIHTIYIEPLVEKKLNQEKPQKKQGKTNT